MFTPSFARSSGAAIAAYKISNLSDLANHFQACRYKKLSGRLDLSVVDNAKPTWGFFFHLGHLIWSVGELHPLRRWNRQLLQYCPQLAVTSLPQKTTHPHPSNYEALVDLVKQGQIQQSVLSAIVAGNILELLFDVLQAAHQSQQPLDMHLTYRPFSPSLIDPTVSTAFEVERAWQRAGQAWAMWQQWGLTSVSPNSAPLVWDDDQLRQQTSLLTYHNLTTLANGSWTLRDLAVKLKQPLMPLTRSLMPYVKQGIMGLNPVGDIPYYGNPNCQLSVAYVEDSRFDSAAMSQILEQAGHQFVSIPNPLQAIQILLEKKPDLIFLDLLMPIANGYEVCTQIRRITAFKDTPIIILTSSDGIVDRVRAKLVGASGFLAKPIEADKVLETLQRYIPGFTASSSTSADNTS